MLFNKITIIGIGLIGGSILKDIKAKKLCGILSAFDYDRESLQSALNQHLINEIPDSLESSIENSDLIIICVPLSKYGSIFKIIDKNCSDKVIITDIGSVKSCVIFDAKNNLSETRFNNFIPSHPIAGSEKSGFKSSKENLYKGKSFYITPLANNNQNSVDLVKDLWTSLGSHIIERSPKEHDEIFALSSHIPHLLSFCYAKTVKILSDESIYKSKEDNKKFAIFIRLAFSNSKMWTDIFLANSSIILNRLEKDFLPYFNFKDNTKLNQILNDINESRRFRKNITIKPAINIDSSNDKKLIHNDLLLDIFPLLISSQIVQSIKSVYSKEIVGAGFLGMTQNLTYDETHHMPIQLNNLPPIAKIFFDELKNIYNLINSKEKKSILNYIESIK